MPQRKNVAVLFIQVLTPFPKTLSNESINRSLVCAQMHSIAQIKKKNPDTQVLDG